MGSITQMSEGTGRITQDSISCCRKSHSVLNFTSSLEEYDTIYFHIIVYDGKGNSKHRIRKNIIAFLVMLV